MTSLARESLMLVEDGVGSRGGRGGCTAIFLGAFDAPSSRLFMPTSMLLSSPSLTASIPIFLLPSRLDAPTLPQSSCVSYCLCKPFPESSHGTATEHDDPCPLPLSLSSMGSSLSLSLFVCRNYARTLRWRLIWHLREYSRLFRRRKLVLDNDFPRC